MNTSQQIGVVILGIAVFLFFWTYNRFTNLIGHLHNWTPPFSQYETVTIVAGLIALVLFLVGLRSVFPKPDDKKKT